MALLSLATAAQAQLGATVSVMSDYRYRGFSLSNQKPALTATLTFDHASGFYGEAVGVVATTRHDDLQALGYQLYAGYARKLDTGMTWDLGASSVDLTEYFEPRYRIRYGEVYGGLSLRNLSAHIYYSPDYLGDRAQTIYGSVDYSRSLRPDWRIFAHGGVLTSLRKARGSDLSNTQYDVGAGAAVRLGPVDLKATLSNFGPSADYPANHRQARTAATVAASYAF